MTETAVDTTTPKLLLSLSNMEAVSFQLQDELVVLAELLQDSTMEKDKDIQAAYDATIELQTELQPLMERIGAMGVELFTSKLTTLERLTFERLGFLVPVFDASSSNSDNTSGKKVGSHYLSNVPNDRNRG